MADQAGTGGETVASGAAAGAVTAPAGLSAPSWTESGPHLPALAVLVILAALLVLYLARMPLARPVIWRAAAVALPLFLLGLAGYLALRGDVPDGEEWRLLQAVVAGGVVALGWIVTFAVGEYRRAEDRSERVRDVLLALREEIFSVLERLDETDIRKAATDTQDDILKGEGERPYMPFSTSQSPPTIFHSVAESIAILPPGALEPVIRFYAAYSDLTALIEDTKRPDHVQLSAMRRKKLHVLLTKQRSGTFIWAVRALIAVNRKLADSRGDHRKVPLSERNRKLWKDIKNADDVIDLVSTPPDEIRA